MPGSLLLLFQSAGSDTVPTPGGGIAAGTTPLAQVLTAQGGAPATGSPPVPRASVPQGGALAAGVSPAPRASVAQGGGVAQGTAGTARVPAPSGGAVAAGNAPTDGSAIEETPTPGGALAAGVPLAPAVLTVISGATATGNQITLVLVPLVLGGAIAAGREPTEAVGVIPASLVVTDQTGGVVAVTDLGGASVSVIDDLT